MLKLLTRAVTLAPPLLAALLPGAGLSAHAAQADERPNVVVVLADDMAAGDLAFMPFTSGLARREGAVFTNAFVNFPMCAPSRASLLTGQAAHNHGVRANLAPDGSWSALQGREDTIGNWMQRAGYRTGMIGDKLLNGWPGKPVMPGFDEFHVALSLRYDCFEMNHNGRLQEHCDRDTWSTDVMRDLALDFIRTPRRKPFFLYLAPTNPKGEDPVAPRHRPARAGVRLPEGPAFNEADVSDKPSFVRAEEQFSRPEIRELEVKYRKRLTSLLALDELMKSLWKTLPRNTIVAFTSDNGMGLGKHRHWNKGWINESTTRVPLVVWAPGIAPGERTQLVNNLDIAATAIDYAGAKTGRALDGRSLRPLLEDASAPWRTIIGIEGRFGTTKDARRFGLSYAARSDRYVYIRSKARIGEVEAEFYDLDVDPDQLENRIDDPAYAGRIGIMRDLTQQLRTCAGEDCWIDERDP
jgi:arylsulfatase A-like enzyme